MNIFEFYYDETEHSPKISYRTITSNNYSDNFVTAIIGWHKEEHTLFKEKFDLFKSNHLGRLTGKGEFKSKSITMNYGFAKASEDTLTFIEDFLDLFDEKLMLQISIGSKLEFLFEQFIKIENIIQILGNQQIGLANENKLQIFRKQLIYSAVKAVLTYRPDKVLRSIYNDPPELFVKNFKDFLSEKIRDDQKNKNLKNSEISAYKIMIQVFHANKLNTINWNYTIPFVALKSYIKENSIDEYVITIDREEKTVNAAEEVNMREIREGDSQDFFGLQISDLMAGIISRLMKEISNALRYTSKEDEVSYKCLSNEWFYLNDERLDLYKKLKNVLNHNKIVKSIYCDDWVYFNAFLDVICQRDSADDVRKNINVITKDINNKAIRNMRLYLEDF